MAERNIQNSIMQRVIDAVRVFLNKLGFTNGDTTDADISALLRDAQVCLKAKGKSVAENSDALSAFSNNATPPTGGVFTSNAQAFLNKELYARTRARTGLETTF